MQQQHLPKVGSLEGWLSAAAAACSSSSSQLQQGAAPRCTSPFAHHHQSEADAFAPPALLPPTPRCASLEARLGHLAPIARSHATADLVCTIHNPCGRCGSGTSSTTAPLCCATATGATSSSTSSSSACAIDVNHEGTMRRGRPRLYHATASSLPLPVTGGGLSLESLCSALSSPASQIAMAAAGGSSTHELHPSPQQPQPHHQYSFIHSASADCCDTSSTSLLAAAAAPSCLSAVHTSCNSSTSAAAVANSSDSSSSSSRLVSLRRQMEQLLLLPLPDYEEAEKEDGCGAASCPCSAAVHQQQPAVPLCIAKAAGCGAVAAAALPAARCSGRAPSATGRRGLSEGTVRGGEPRNQWVWVAAAPPPAVAAIGC